MVERGLYIIPPFLGAMIMNIVNYVSKKEEEVNIGRKFFRKSGKTLSTLFAATRINFHTILASFISGNSQLEQLFCALYVMKYL